MRGPSMKKKNAATEYRTPLFDRLFKPQVITLPNGHTVERPRSRQPLIWICVAAAVWASVVLTGFDFSILIKRGHQFTVILKQIFQPDWSFLPKVIGPLVDTIKMSILGSVLGATLALPFAVVSSTNINRNGIVVALCRFLLNLIRTLPTLVIAKFAALIFGLGTFAGTMAITVFTFAWYPRCCTRPSRPSTWVPSRPWESAGGNKFQSFWSACFPQILPTYLSYCLYSLEMNIRAAAILAT